jgi:V/A-type H+-transporting ATPase subunit E
MESKIQELTDKIYREGVAKGNEEAQRLIESAQNEAQSILENARREAAAIVASAEKASKEKEEHTKSELKLFAAQALNALKTEVTNLITNQVVSSSVKEVVANKETLNSFILAIATQWSANEPITISTADAASLKNFFLQKSKNLLDKGVKIEQVNGQKALFSISPADGTYKVNFGEEEFENYFKGFLRPQLVEMLF